MSEPSKPTIKKLGPYRITGVVGRGGMGSVFSAVHEESGETAAIKVLAPALAADQTFRDRFVAEIDSLEKLNHSHIVTLHGYGEADGHLYYSMELVEGTNLEQELSSGRRFTWREVTQIGIDISRALKHAHDHGVIHRDLKPANLLVDKDEKVKLTDFGIAKLFGATQVTFNGSVLGTADYMAPEQAAGEATTPRCDLYSLGCVLYALLAGKPPFRGKSIAEVVHKVRYETHDPVSKYNNDVPRDLQVIIDELLEKDPDARIRTALSLTHRLSAMQQASSISTTSEANFSADMENAPGDNRTQRIVNPPPDIADRPTVLLPNESASPPTVKVATKKQKKKTLDHFTRVELEKARTSDGGRGAEFSSAVPLLLLLLTVLGGLMGGMWYSRLPMTADDLHARIMNAAEDPSRLSNAGRDVARFLEKFPDDTRAESVRKLQEEIEVQRLQKALEIRSRGRKETGSLSPIEVHCNEAFRRHREGDIEGAIHILEGVDKMFGQSNETDIGIQRTLLLVERLLPTWREELSREISGLRTNIPKYRGIAKDISVSDPVGAREIWQGIIDLYKDRSWAGEFVEEARAAIAELDPIIAAMPTDEQPDNADSAVEDGGAEKLPDEDDSNAQEVSPDGEAMQEEINGTETTTDE